MKTPQLIQEQPFHVPKATALCAVTTEMIIGPNFFEDASGSALWLPEKLQGNVERIFIATSWTRRVKHEYFYFQQDEKFSQHTARETKAMLREAIPGRLISGSGDLSRFDFARLFFVRMPEI